MNHDEEISQLKKELLQLHEQTKSQHQNIMELYQRLQQIAPEVSKQVTPKSKTETSTFSLENFIGLKLLHFIGIVVLVIGLSIGVKYAIDRNLISELMRIALAYTAGAVLFFLSVQLKKRYLLFSAILLSGAMASLYFTTYGAFVFYAMMRFTIAFLIMTGLTFFTVYQALSYNRQEIAMLGLVGAYAIPFLISANTGRADLFFLYILLINIGIVYLAIKKEWRATGIVAQVVTWLLFLGWAGARFEAKWMAIGLVFMSAFFLLFYFNALAGRIFCRKNIDKEKLEEPRRFLKTSKVLALRINNMALYGGCLLLFGQYYTNPNYAIITLAMAGLMAVQAAIFYFVWEDAGVKKFMASFSFLLFVAFIALQWNGLTVTLLWLLTAVIVFTIGAIKKWPVTRMAAMILIGATLIKLVLIDSLVFTTVQKVIAYILLGVLLLVVSFFYQKFKEKLFGGD